MAPQRRKSGRANGSAASKQVSKRSAPAPSEPETSVRAKKFECVAELRRELTHTALHSSIAFFAIYGIQSGASIPTVVHGLTGALAIIVSADLLRFRSPGFERFYESVLGFLMRPSERTSWNGADESDGHLTHAGVIFYLLGCIFVLTLAPVDIGVFSIVLLSWCDTAASTFGRTFGKYTPALPKIFAERKSFAGTAAAVFVGGAAARYYWTHVPAPSWSLAPTPMTLPPQSYARPFSFIPRLPPPKSTLSLNALTIVCGIIGGVAEGIEIWGLDDNLSLPALASILLYVTLSVLG